MRIRTILIDDEPLVRSSLLRALRHDKDIEVVREGGDGVSAGRLAGGNRPGYKPARVPGE